MATASQASTRRPSPTARPGPAARVALARVALARVALARVALGRVALSRAAASRAALALAALALAACHESTRRPDAALSALDSSGPPNDGPASLPDVLRDSRQPTVDGPAATVDGSPQGRDGAVTDAASSAGDAGPSDAGPSDAGPSDAGASGPLPTIPQPDGPCPTFSSGTQTIKDLPTRILAGAPGAARGPLLFTWHGTGGSGALALLQLPSSTRNEITAQGGLIIAPTDNGLTRVGYSPNGVWYETSDLEYADHIVACAVRDHNIDPRRIYVTGCSAGGLMAAAMAIKRSGYVAAAYPNSGGLITVQGLSLQDPAHVPAVMTLHGGAADTVIINFEQTSARLQDLIYLAGGFGVDCNHQSGHCGAPADLLEHAWTFAQAHPFGTVPSPYVGGLPGDFPDYCAIWSGP